MGLIHSVVDLGYRQTPDYPYTYRVQLTNDLVAQERMYDWVDQTEIQCYIIKNVVYLKKEDLTLFMLAWG